MIRDIYIQHKALLEGHFILSSGKHSKFYLQSARVLENPKTAEKIMKELAKKIIDSGIEVDTVCSPALGGVLAGYELARALGVRFIFTERKEKDMELRRGFSVSKGERVLICEDIITTGGSALEAANIVENLGGNVVGFAAIANRGFCMNKPNCKLPKDKPLFFLGNFEFDVYDPEECPLCEQGVKAVKPGSRKR
jgi:orotate phosphoribosyltransferase